MRKPQDNASKNRADTVADFAVMSQFSRRAACRELYGYCHSNGEVLTPDVRQLTTPGKTCLFNFFLNAAMLKSINGVFPGGIMLPSRTLSLTIPRNWLDLYESIWKPEFFPKWASGLSHAPLVNAGNVWKGRGPEGNIKVRFTPHNLLGVMDHYVDTGLGKEIYVPMRVIANQEGAEIVVTLFRQPLMSDEKFEQDIRWIERDLQTLYKLMTS